ncbi:hypothetical protein VIGAN_07190900 [Vigna angularis var. angularis]|uniref:Uncharacterized protein n=1 Tax=Vigna angularis var. angularis TaxID=157739 RepID=A0A0S3SJQ1_PHAAN|nr:hypothetical protein VIGAN_07190900 [Vigna angularis var. angularis]
MIELLMLNAFWLSKELKMLIVVVPCTKRKNGPRMAQNVRRHTNTSWPFTKTEPEVVSSTTLEFVDYFTGCNFPMQFTPVVSSRTQKPLLLSQFHSYLDILAFALVSFRMIQIATWKQSNLGLLCVSKRKKPLKSAVQLIGDGARPCDGYGIVLVMISDYGW